MLEPPHVGRTLILIGVLFAGAGAVMLVAPKMPWIGRLPGDIAIERERLRVYIPLASCLLASVVLSLVFWIIGRFR